MTINDDTGRTTDPAQTAEAEPVTAGGPVAEAGPAAVQPEAARTKTRRNWIIAGAAAGLVLLLCCSAAIFSGLVWLNRETPQRVVDAYLSAVQQHDRPRAERLLCDGLRRGAAGRLTGLAQDWMEIVDWDITDIRDSDRSAEVAARVTFKISGVASTNNFRFTLINEDGDWLICGFQTPGVAADPR
jgi:hypothetical protein